MLNYNYFYSLLFLMLASKPISLAVENPQEDYRDILVVLIIFVPMYLFFISLRKRSYIIENVKINNLINIITKYFDKTNINYEVRKKEIYLPGYYKRIGITGKKELILDLKEIAELTFYDELLEYIKIEIKNIEEKTFPFMGGVYLLYAGILYWLLKWIK